MESVDGGDRRPTLCAQAGARNRSSVIVLLARNECSDGMIVWPRMKREEVWPGLVPCISISIKALTNDKTEASRSPTKTNLITINVLQSFLISVRMEGGRFGHNS